MQTLISHTHYVNNVNLYSLLPIEKANSIALFQPQIITNTLGDVFKKYNIKQACVAETEKYAHKLISLMVELTSFMLLKPNT